MLLIFGINATNCRLGGFLHKAVTALYLTNLFLICWESLRGTAFFFFKEPPRQLLVRARNPIFEILVSHIGIMNFFLKKQKKIHFYLLLSGFHPEEPQAAQGQCCQLNAKYTLTETLLKRRHLAAVMFLFLFITVSCDGFIIISPCIIIVIITDYHVELGC